MWSFPACPGSGMGRVRLDVSTLTRCTSRKKWGGIGRGTMWAPEPPTAATKCSGSASAPTKLRCVTLSASRGATQRSGCAAIRKKAEADAQFSRLPRKRSAARAFSRRCACAASERNESAPSRPPDAGLTCGRERKNEEADMETARLRGGGMQRVHSDVNRPISALPKTPRWESGRCRADASSFCLPSAFPSASSCA